MRDPNMEIRVHHSDSYDGIDVYFIRREGRKTWIGRPVEIAYEEVAENAPWPHGPTMRFHRVFAKDFLQAIVDLAPELRQFGCVPHEGPLDGIIKRLEDHLRDMRRLVFNGKLPEEKERK